MLRAASVMSGGSTGRFRWTRGQSPHVLIAAPQAVPSPLAPLAFSSRRGLLRRRLALAEPLDDVRDVRELLLEVPLILLQPLEPFLAVAEPAEAVAPVAPMSVAHGHLPSRTGRGTTRRAPGSRAARPTSRRAGAGLRR